MGKTTSGDLVRKLVVALDRHDLEAALATVSPNFRMYWAGEPDMVKSRSEYRTHWETYYREHPGTRVKLVSLVEGVENIAAELSASYLPSKEEVHPGSKGRRKRIEARFAVFAQLDSKGLLAVARLENGRIVNMTATRAR